MSLDSCHDSRLMKSTFIKKQYYKGFMIFHKNTENYWWQHGSLSLFCNFMEYESRLIKYFYRIGFHDSWKKLINRIRFYESPWNTSVYSWKNTHKMFIELTPATVPVVINQLEFFLQVMRKFRCPKKVFPK